MDSKAAQLAIGTLATIALAVSSFALTELYQMNSDIKLLQATEKHEQRVERTLRMHWKLHRWAHDEINTLRDFNNLAPVRWPDIGERPS